jgi:hypothetical protein
MKYSFKLLLTGLVILILNPQLHAQVAFALAGNYVMGSNSVSVTAADINGDGQMDLIVENNGTLILTNNGNGQFGSNAMVTAVVADKITVADVNGDGKLDLIWSDESISGHLWVFTNNGSGGFGSNGVYAVGQVPDTPLAVDVNNDGKLDLICANRANQILSVLTNNGTGGFKLASSPATGSDGGPVSVVAADVNNDGKLDLICANYGNSLVGHTLSVLTNSGGGIFKLSSTPTVGPAPISVVAMDINGDSKVDLICANSLTNTLSVLTNNGSGVFGSNATLTVGLNHIGLIAADVNGDGKPDLIFVQGTNAVSILANNGSGGFNTNPILIAVSNPLNVIAADVNGDGRQDLICVNTGLQNGIYVTNSSLSVLVNVPTLTSIYSSNNLTVSWPSSWTNWTLSQNPDLTTTNWTASTGIANDGTNKSLTVPALANSLFFRLAHP